MYLALMLTEMSGYSGGIWTYNLHADMTRIDHNLKIEKDTLEKSNFIRQVCVIA